MAAIRFLSWFILALAIALLGADAVSSLEEGVPTLRTTAEILKLVGLDVAGLAGGGGAGGVGGAVATLFSLPLWAVLGLVGVVLTLVFRPID